MEAEEFMLEKVNVLFGPLVLGVWPKNRHSWAASVAFSCLRTESYCPCPNVPSVPNLLHYSTFFLVDYIFQKKRRRENQ